MYKVIVSPGAWDDFFEIFEYIAADSRDAAAKFCDALLNHVDLLAEFPHIGIPSARVRGVRSMLHTPVRVYYRTDERRQCVEILHFWHTARSAPTDV